MGIQSHTDKYLQLISRISHHAANIPEDTEHEGLGEARYWQLCNVSSPTPQVMLSTHLSPMAAMGMLQGRDTDLCRATGAWLGLQYWNSLYLIGFTYRSCDLVIV